ncbi:MAG: hypothetical protein QOE63_1806, partial [Acidimicrobiaceae bacterium]
MVAATEEVVAVSESENAELHQLREQAVALEEEVVSLRRRLQD